MMGLEQLQSYLVAKILEKKVLITKKTVLFASLVIVGSGCSSVLPYTDPYGSIDIQSSTRLPPARVVELLPDETVDLSRIIEVAKANNPTLAITRLSVARAQALVQLSHAKNMPQLSVASTIGRYSDEQRVMPPSMNGELGAFSHNIADANIILSYPLFTGGALNAAEGAAEFSTQAARMRSIRARQELVYSVTTVFYRYLKQQKLTESIEFNRKTLMSHLERISVLVAAKKRTKLDKLRVDVQLADLDQKLVQSKNLSAILEKMLATLMGIEKADFTIAGELQGPELVDGNGEDADTLIQIAKQDRADYKAMEAQLWAQAKMVDAAKGGKYPTVSAFASYGERWGIDSDNHSSGVDSSGDTGMIGLSISFPLWDAGLTQSKIDTELATLFSMQKGLEAMNNQIVLEVQTAYLNKISALERFKSSQKSVEQATEVQRIQNETYRLGKATMTDLLDAQTAVLNAQTNYYSAIAEFKTAQAQLNLAVGREEK